MLAAIRQAFPPLLGSPNSQPIDQMSRHTEARKLIGLERSIPCHLAFCKPNRISFPDNPLHTVSKFNLTRCSWSRTATRAYAHAR